MFRKGKNFAAMAQLVLVKCQISPSNNRAQFLKPVGWPLWLACNFYRDKKMFLQNIYCQKNQINGFQNGGSVICSKMYHFCRKY